jgi:nucleotide-binding universal stress UspA family protein
MAKRILLPIDLADPHDCDAAVPVALEEARLHGAELHVVTVLPDFGMSQVSSFFREGYEKEALAKMGADLKGWVATNVPAGIAVRPHVLHGSIYDEILRAAETLDVDLIVICARRPSMAEYLLGRNTERIVRHARRSVYVVRERNGAS